MGTRLAIIHVTDQAPPFLSSDGVATRAARVLLGAMNRREFWTTDKHPITADDHHAAVASILGTECSSVDDALGRLDDVKLTQLLSHFTAEEMFQVLRLSDGTLWDRLTSFQPSEGEPGWKEKDVIIFRLVTPGRHAIVTSLVSGLNRPTIEREE